ncbi:hypothetical protein RYX36_006924, partial [Vicia faba]
MVINHRMSETLKDEVISGSQCFFDLSNEDKKKYISEKLFDPIRCAHIDHRLLTLLMQNELCGLQIEHNGKWIPVNPLPNSFLMNNGDHLK